MNNSWTIPQYPSWSIPDNLREIRSQKAPYHERFRDYFAAEIEVGKLRQGARLPAERELAEKFSITRVTVRQALIRMEAEGLIFREDRKGWYISPPRVLYDPTSNTSFTKSIARQGRQSSTTVLSKSSSIASRRESDLLECATGDQVFVISRLRKVDGRAILVEQTHIRADRCPGLLDLALDGSLTDLMAKNYGIIEQRVQITMRPTAIPEIPAKALGVAVGTPGLYVMRTILDQSDNVVEIDEEFWRHDAINICISTSTNVVERPKGTEHIKEIVNG